MRQIKYISPSSFALFEQDRTEFYLRYCAEGRVPKIPQNHPMSIGSAFDAFVKNYLVGHLFGSVPDQFAIEAIFESQVEEQNRSWAFEHGESLFNAYRSSGALADLLIELSGAVADPRFEFSVESRIAHSAHPLGIPLLGKPDAYCKLSDRALIIDWKVNGFCASASRPVSPKKGYTRLRESRAVGAFGSNGFGSNGFGSNGFKSHKDCQIMGINGINVNIASTLDTVDVGWASQLCIYMWVLGEPIGTRAICGVEQLCCAGEERCAPLRVASHRSCISAAFQTALLDRLALMWTAITTGHIFDRLSRADSDSRCHMLDLQNIAYSTECVGFEDLKGVKRNEANEEWFKTTTRG